MLLCHWQNLWYKQTFLPNFQANLTHNLWKSADRKKVPYEGVQIFYKRHQIL